MHELYKIGQVWRDKSLNQIGLFKLMLITAETIIRLKNLKYIGILATGYDMVDTEAACRCLLDITV